MEVLIQDTEPFTDAAREARETFGIQPRPVRNVSTARSEVEEVFLGVAFTCGAEEQVIGFFDVGLPAEYELMRSIRVVAGTGRKRVGVVATMANLFGGTNFQRNQFTPQWSVVTELRKQYDVVEISPEMAIGQDVDALLVPLPSSLQTDEQGFVADYIRSGKPALILVDPLPAVNPTLSPSEWVGDGNPFTYPPGQPRPGPRGNVREWIRALGVDWEPTRIVWDAYNPHPELAHMPEDVVFLGAGNENPATFDAGDPMTAQLQELVLLFPGSLQAVDDPRFEFQPLLRSGLVSGANGYFSLVRGTPFGPQVNPSPPRRQDDDDYIVAARIRSVGGAAAGEAEDAADDAGAGATGDAGAEAGQAPAGEAAAEPETATDAAESPEVAAGEPDDEAAEPESGAAAPAASGGAAESDAAETAAAESTASGTAEAGGEPGAVAEEAPEAAGAPAGEAEAGDPEPPESPEPQAEVSASETADSSASRTAESSATQTAEPASQTAESSASRTAESAESREPESVEAPAAAQEPEPESVETPAEAQEPAAAESPAAESGEEQNAEPADAADTAEPAAAAEETDPVAEAAGEPEQAAADEPESDVAAAPEATAAASEATAAVPEPDIEPESDVAAEGAAEPEAAGDIDIIVVADLDFISEQFFQIREQAPGGLNFDNITFFLNAMDTLLGEDAFIDLRSRRARHRTLERVEAQTAEFIEQRTADEQQAEADAEEALTEAQQRLNDRVAELQGRADIDAQTRQIMVRNLEEVENRRLEVLSANIETEKDTRIQASRENMEAQIRRIQTSIKTFAILLPPVPVVMLGIAIFIRRKRREREGAAAAHRLRE